MTPCIERMEIKDDFKEVFIMLKLPQNGIFQKHILDPKNATAAFFTTKPKFYLKKVVYLVGLPLLKTKKEPRVPPAPKF
jgi:hypothetical protein